GGNPDVSNSSLYQAPSGAWVFATGTMAWSWGLDSFNNAGTRTNIPTDARIQQTTTNLLNAFLAGAPGVLHDLKLTAPASATAGQAFTVTVTAEDGPGNPVTSYNGTVHFSSTDTTAGVVLPPDSTLTNGQGTFSATLIKAGAQTLTASDAASNFAAAANLTVSPASAASLELTPSTATPTAGNGFTVTVVAHDGFGNLATNYGGT